MYIVWNWQNAFITRGTIQSLENISREENNSSAISTFCNYLIFLNCFYQSYNYSINYINNSEKREKRVKRES